MEQARQFFRVVNGNLTEYLLFLIVILLTLVDCTGRAIAGDGGEATVAPLIPAGLDWKTLAIVGVLAAPIAMVITQMGKKALAKMNADCPGDPFWWQWGLRLLSVAAGAGTGMLLLTDALAWGAMSGAAGGALSSVIVATLRKQIRNVANPPPEA